LTVVGALGARLGVDRSNMTATTVIGRAVVAGIVGGLLTALFVAFIGEQSINAAIAIEESAATSSDTTTPEVSRSVQVAGGVAAVALYGVLTGIVFGTVLAAVRHRITVADDFRRSVLLAAAGFGAVALLPAVKYPANPPAIGDPDTIGERTLTYLSLVAAGLVLAAGCALLYRRLRHRFDEPSALALTTLAAIVGAVGLGLLWPGSPDQVPDAFPAALLWRFRLQSLAALALQWSALGLVTGWLLTRPATHTGDGGGRH
jgi:predicted cobalt transporter CbtA